MTIRAHAVVAGLLMVACLASPPSPAGDGAWFFHHEPVQGGDACMAALDHESGRWQLAFAWAADGSPGLAAQLTGPVAELALPAGFLCSIEFPDGSVHQVRVEARGDAVVRLAVDGAERLLTASPAADGIIWLEFGGAVALAFPLAGWRDAMRGIAACAS